MRQAEQAPSATILPRQGAKGIFALVCLALLATVALLNVPRAGATIQGALEPLTVIGTDSPGAGPGQFGAAGTGAVAADNTTGASKGSYYVADPANNRIQKFDAWGQFVLMFGRGVNQTTGGNVCTAASGDVCGAGASYTGTGTGDSVTGTNGNLANPRSVAVDNAGNVIVADTANNRVQKFDPQGNFILMYGGGVDQTTAANVCTAASGDVCGTGTAGTAAGQFSAGAATKLAVRSSNGTVYVADAGRIQTFNSAGAVQAATISLAGSGAVKALGVDSSGNAYVTTESGPLSSGVFVFSASGAYSQVLDAGGKPTAVFAVTSSEVYVADGVGRSNFKIGQYGTAPGATFTPFTLISTKSSTFGASSLAFSSKVFPTELGRTIGDLAFFYADAPKVAILGPTPTTPPPPPVAPAVGAPTASGIGTSAASISAPVNPHFAATTYFVQYGSQDCSANPCAQSPAAPGAALNKIVNVDVSATQVISGLSPNTTYHYRLAATNAAGTTYGPDATFATLASGKSGAAGLPDGRAYELVSPAQKYGYGVGDNTGSPTVRLGIAPDGARVTYDTMQPLEGSNNGTPLGMLATRTGSEWENTGIASAPGPNESGLGIPWLNSSLRGCTPDQRTCVYWDNSTLPYGSLNMRRADGSYQKIVDASAVALSLRGEGAGQAWFSGITDDGRHVIFASNQRLLPGLPSGSADILYEWIDDGSNGGAGTIRVVNRTQSPTLTLVNAGNAELGGSTSGAANARQGLTSPRGLRHAISDGSDGHLRIFFQNVAPTSETTTTGGQIYLREDDSRTVQVSAPEGANPASTELRYLDASADGTKAFFWSGSKLTDDPGAGAGIYRYDVDASGGAGDLVFLASAPAVSSAPPTAIASDDGSRIYYQKGSDLYVNTDGVDQLVLGGVSTVGGGGYLSNEFESNSGTGSLNGLSDSLGCTGASITPGEGRFLAFPANDGRTHVYRFDAQSGAQAQQIDTGPAAPPSSTYDGLLASGNCGNPAYPPIGSTHLISDDGSRVFFDTSGALVPGDSNGRIVDTYEWHDGQVSLISSGTDTQNSGAYGATPDGSDVFFGTHQALVPQDGDHEADIYDARIGGGFPYAAPAAPCQGDGCQGAASGGPGAVSTASANLAGPGNANARKAAKKHKKPRKAKHKRHAKHKKHARKQAKRTANSNRRASR